MVANPIIYRLVPRPSRFETRQWRNFSAVRGYHVYKVDWKPTIGEKLQVDQELGNEANKFPVKVVKNNEIVGNLPREYSRTLWYFIARGGKICVEVTGCKRHCKQLCGGNPKTLTPGPRTTPMDPSTDHLQNKI